MKNGNGRVIKGRDQNARGRSPHESLKSTWPFIFGHCPSLTTYLNSKIGWGWIPPKFVNALLRSIAQVVFANNPFTGLFVLVGITWYSWSLGVIVIASTSVAILTAFITKQNVDDICSGGVSFNAVLLASVTVSLWKPLYNEEVDIKIYLLILIGASYSILLYKGLSNLLSSFHPPVPILSVPFHVLVIMLFACLKPDVLPPGEDETSHNHLYNHNASSPDLLPFMDLMMSNSTNDIDTELYSWKTLQNVLQSLPLYSSQVFGFPDQSSGLVIYAGMLLYSPLLTAMCMYGGFVSTVVGLLLAPSTNEQIFTGVFGFNGFLAGGATTLFFVFNRYCFMNATANAAFTALVQSSITNLFAKWQMPVFGLPFLFSTVIFISVTGGDKVSGQKHFIRLEGITFPEMDRKKYYARISSRSHQAEDEECAAGRNLMDATQ